MRKSLKRLAVAAMCSAMCFSPLATSLTTISAYAKTTLETPSNVHWGNKKDDDEGFYAHWDEVENAKKYNIYIYYINDNDSYSKIAEMTTAKTSVNLKGKLTKSDVDYTFRVRAVGSGNYTTSSWSDYADEMYYEKSTTTSSTAVNTSSTNSAGPGGTSTGATGSQSNIGPSVPSTPSEGGWRQNTTGWWYAKNAAGTEWYRDGWYWIDGNKDGVSECYYFDANGYMLANTTTPDGYQVNNDGAWIVDGITQTR